MYLITMIFILWPENNNFQNKLPTLFKITFKLRSNSAELDRSFNGDLNYIIS